MTQQRITHCWEMNWWLLLDKYAYSGALICIRVTGFVTHTHTAQNKRMNLSTTRDLIVSLTGFLDSAKWSANRKIIQPSDKTEIK
jgi:hypothetical protein